MQTPNVAVRCAHMSTIHTLYHFRHVLHYNAYFRPGTHSLACLEIISKSQFCLWAKNSTSHCHLHPIRPRPHDNQCALSTRTHTIFVRSHVHGMRYTHMYVSPVNIRVRIMFLIRALLTVVISKENNNRQTLARPTRFRSHDVRSDFERGTMHDNHIIIRAERPSLMCEALCQTKSITIGWGDCS